MPSLRLKGRANRWAHCGMNRAHFTASNCIFRPLKKTKKGAREMFRTKHRAWHRPVIAILLLCSASASAQNAPVTIDVDVNLNRRLINPNIYGVAHATTAQLNDLNSPLNRNGGNNTTRYNWQLNADNRAND